MSLTWWRLFGKSAVYSKMEMSPKPFVCNIFIHLSWACLCMCILLTRPWWICLLTPLFLSCVEMSLNKLWINEAVSFVVFWLLTFCERVVFFSVTLKKWHQLIQHWLTNSNNGWLPIAFPTLRWSHCQTSNIPHFLLCYNHIANEWVAFVNTFGQLCVQISAQRPALLFRVFHGFPKTLQAHPSLGSHHLQFIFHQCCRVLLTPLFNKH